MKVLIDGKEVEAKEIQIVHENQIVGCHCNSGSHTEVMGDYIVTLDEDNITVDIISDDEYAQSCVMNLDNLLSEMEKTVLVMENKGEIAHLSNIFHKI